MTREEAIELIKAYRDKLTNSVSNQLDGDIEAFELAIKALEQEPSGDLISRQAVLDGIEELKKSPWATDKRGNGFEYLIKEALDVVADLCVKQEPSVNSQEPTYYLPCIDCNKKMDEIRHAYDKLKEQEPSEIIHGSTYGGVSWGGTYNPQERTGHWEWVQYDYNPKFGNWHCSECRCVVVECVGKEEKGGIPLYKYCPQCGAKMVEPQESEG